MRRGHGIFYRIDWIMVVLYLVLVLFGWLNIYSTVYDEHYGSIFDISRQYGKQMIWILAAFLLALMTILVEPKIFSQLSYLIYAGFIFSLILVLVFGREISGTRSWFHFGSIAIQPAEFAKAATALAIAKYLSRFGLDIKRARTWLIAGCIVSLPAAIILLQKDTGSAIVFLAFIIVFYRFGLNRYIVSLFILLPVLGMLALTVSKIWLAGILLAFAIMGFFLTRRKLRHLLITAAIYLSLAGYILSVNYAFHHLLKAHQRERINVLIGKTSDVKGAGYNVNQSLIAIGSGKIFGKGYLNGTQTKYNFVPEQSTDFIFCTVGEEWGLAGSLIVIGLYIGLLIRILFIAERQRAKFSKVYGYSVAALLFFHVFINIGMTLGLLPVIGIPLPFLSYGGSSLWAFTILLFIFIRQDSYRYELI